MSIKRVVWHRITAIVLAVGMIISLSACGSSSASAPAEVNTYDVYLDIEFEQNLLFATYDIEIYFDDSRVGLIPHGKHFTNLIEDAAEGTHKVCFYKDGDHSVKASRDIKIHENCTCIATIHSNKSDIDVKSYETRAGIVGNALVMVDVLDHTLEDAINELKQVGFTNIYYSDDIWNRSNWVVSEQNIAAGTSIDKNTKIELVCSKPEASSESDTEDSSLAESTENPANGDIQNSEAEISNSKTILTADNNEDLAALLNADYVDLDAQNAFAQKYDGRTIEFDCLVYYIEQYESYGTRFNYVLIPGDDMDSIGASLFMLENVGYYDFKLEKENKPRSVNVGARLKMQAEVRGFEDMYIMLKPVKTVFKGMAKAL